MTTEAAHADANDRAGHNYQTTRIIEWLLAEAAEYRSRCIPTKTKETRSERS